MRRNKQIDIRRALALSSTFNFLYSCAKACLLPFLTLYFRQLGLTPAMTGLVMGLKHLISLVWSPLSSLLAEHYNKRKAVINGSVMCSAAVALVLLLFPLPDVHTHISSCNTSDLRSRPTQGVADNLLMKTPGPTTPSTGTRPNINTTSVSQPGVTSPASLADTKSAALMTSQRSTHRHVNESTPQAVGETSRSEPTNSSSVVNDTTGTNATLVRNKRDELKPGSEKQPEQKKDEIGLDFMDRLKTMDAQHQLFFLILIIVSVWELVAAPLEWTADDGLYEYLDFADASDHYSRTRVWSLLGAACGVGGAGLVVSQLRCLLAGQIPRSAVHFFCYTGLAALALPVAAYLPLYLNKKRNKVSRLLKAVQLVRGSPCALLGAVTTLLVGMAGSAVDNFLLWQMQDHGSSELHMGLSLALALLSQAAFPLLVGRMSRLFSPGRVLVFGAASLSVQCFYYSFLWGPWVVLPAQLLSCFSSGALWWAVNVQCDDVAIPGAERSVRRVSNVLSPCLGSGLGSVAGGFVVQRFGLAWLFRGLAVALLVWCVCLPVLQWRAPRQRRINYSRLLAADASEASDSGSDQERDWLDKAMEDDRSNNKYGGRRNR